MIKLINKTGQTIFIQDLNINIPYYEDHRFQFISHDDFQKSLGFRKFSISNDIEFYNLGNSLIEKNFLKFKNSYKGNVVNKILENKETNIVIRGHIFDSGGYSKVNQNLTRGLKSLYKNVNIDPFDENKSNISMRDFNYFSKLKGGLGKNSITIDSIVPSFGRKVSCKKSILYTTVESSTLPKQFKDCMSLYDEIWVTSDFCKNVIESETDKNVKVLPNSINTDIYKPFGDKFDFNPGVKKFIFGSVFNWNYRKGYDALINSYIKEFTDEDQTTLMLVTKNFHDPKKNKDIKDYIDNKLKGKKNAPHIVRISNFISEEEMADLYRSFNAFVLFSRGEGFCYPLAEASLCGVPVIATNHSGHTMYLNENNSKLVEIDKMSKLSSGLSNVHYWDGQYFADLTTEDFIDRAGKAMRDVYENISLYKIKNNLLKTYLNSNYNISNISNIAYGYLKEYIE